MTARGRHDRLDLRSDEPSSTGESGRGGSQRGGSLYFTPLIRIIMTVRCTPSPRPSRLCVNVGVGVPVAIRALIRMSIFGGKSDPEAMVRSSPSRGRAAKGQIIHVRPPDKTRLRYRTDYLNKLFRAAFKSFSKLGEAEWFEIVKDLGEEAFEPPNALPRTAKSYGKQLGWAGVEIALSLTCTRKLPVVANEFDVADLTDIIKRTNLKSIFISLSEELLGDPPSEME